MTPSGNGSRISRALEWGTGRGRGLAYAKAEDDGTNLQDDSIASREISAGTYCACSRSRTPPAASGSAFLTEVRAQWRAAIRIRRDAEAASDSWMVELMSGRLEDLKEQVARSGLLGSTVRPPGEVDNTVTGSRREEATSGR